MDSIELAAQFQSLFSKFSHDNNEAVIDELESILKDSNKQIFVLFSRIFCNFVSKRSKEFQIYANLFKIVPSLSNPELKDIFLTSLKAQMIEPDQPEICEFFTYLVESNYIDVENALDLLLSIFKSPEKLQNIQFCQFLFCIYRIQNLFKGHQKFNEKKKEFQIRNDNIKININLDDKKKIFLFLYEQLCKQDHNSIKKKLSDDAEHLLQNQFDILEPNLVVSPSILSFSPSIACACAFYGALNCLKALSAHGVDLNQPDDEERTIAQFAAAGGSVEVLKFLKEKRVSFSGALEYAAQFYRNEAFEYLTSVCRLDGRIFHSAVKSNNIHIIKYLISKNVPFETRDEYNWTPLHIAASQNSIESVTLLLSIKNINVNIADLDGETPLHCAAKDGYVEVMEILLKHPNINPFVKDQEDATPLHWASCNNQPEAVRLLMNSCPAAHQKNFDVNCKDAFNRTPLILSCSSNSPLVTEILLTHPNINVNAYDKRETTPLIAAVESKSFECVKKLVESASNKIDFNKRNVEGTTALDIAAFADCLEIVQYLLGINGVDASDLNNQNAIRQLPKRIGALITEHFSKK
ncbi:hypothetical protein TRFO_21314 [Tritrichomonas foetus]|uniref:Ankyrin repeat protein n=1 Tax=Tritrichomonas foetus TaxID=1144522 RepID=A0A1J4KE40_9EUKA|nr:hypothetical protein TRFO_21314 [Tritrichomonas foetus]|eukprot:OHT09695.1 hypothetical protein TRFO_21314 [Tritrichomonas foetus]